MNRIWHHWKKWECYEAGFYGTTPPNGMTTEEAQQAYSYFLSDLTRFESALKRVLIEWPNSCEHFLSNESMNRIAWLGQSSMCLEMGVSSCFKAGFRFLTPEKQSAANKLAEKYLLTWLARSEKQMELLDGID